MLQRQRVKRQPSLSGNATVSDTKLRHIELKFEKLHRRVQHTDVNIVDEVYTKLQILGIGRMTRNVQLVCINHSPGDVTLSNSSSTCLPAPLSPSTTHSLFHTMLKTHVFHSLLHLSLLTPTGLPSRIIRLRTHSTHQFSFLVIFLSYVLCWVVVR